MTEDEFVLYIKQTGGKDGKFDVLETGRDIHQSTFSEKERRFQNQEKYEVSVQEELDKEQAAQKVAMRDELEEELKVFKDCSVRELIEIFGIKTNVELPLYVNLWILREYIRLLGLKMAICD